MASRKGRGTGDRVEPNFDGSGGGPALDLRLSPDDRAGGSVGRNRKAKAPRKHVKDDTSRRDRGAGRKRNRRAPRRGSILGRTARGMVYWGAVLGVWLTLAVGGVFGWYVWQLPNAANLEIPARPPSIAVLAVDGTELAQRGKMRGHAVALRDLPPSVSQAVIATEDSRFYNHFGVDPIGLVRALVANFQAGGVVQGGSTLTQQLAKNMFLKPERTIERKVQEVGLAFWLEKRFSKDEILEMYLNRVYYGAGAYGVEAAAQRYFDKSARDLTLPESAILAGLLKAPSRFAPTRNPKAAAERARIVLARMVDEGYITREEGKHAMALPATVAQPRMASVGYVADWVADQVESFVGEISSDVIVETTIDANLQLMAERALVAVMAEEGAEKGASQAALVAIDGIGAVRALVGGVNYKASQFNRAVTAKRQPGSAFKPFVYLSALEIGLTPETVRVDGPTRIAGWTPQNYSGEYRGPVKLATGLSKSLNTIAARLTEEVGPSTVAATARRLGITSQLHENPSIALGTAEVSLLELAGAYVPFSNGGYGTVPHVVRRIVSRDGTLLYERTGTGPGRVIDPVVLGEINYMMAKTVTEGTGKNAALANWPAAGKTGTSQDFRDAWFMGFTANLVAGVWVGNDDGTPTKKATGGSVPAKIWQRFMTAAHEGLPPQPLPGDYVPRPDQGVPVAENLPWLQDGQQQAAIRPQRSVEPHRYEGPVEQPRQPFGFLRRLFSGG